MADELVSNRISISVPDFDTRWNMGTTDPDAGPSHPAFGYTGYSVHSNFNFFVDIGRVGLYQSNLGSCWQVGGKWLQWSNNDMYQATLGNNTLAADSKVLIAAGAGWGQVTALTAAGSVAESPRLVEYNNLQLHWRVDAVQVALKQFFYGYGTTSGENRFFVDSVFFQQGKIMRSGDGDDGWRSAGKVPRKDKDSFTRKDTQEHYSEPNSDDTADPKKQYPGGFLKDVDDLLGKLDQQSLKARLLKPFEWEGSRIDMGNMSAGSSSFAAFDPFDPYPSSFMSQTAVLTQLYAITIQVMNWMHRTVDVLRRVGSSITDNVYGKRAQAFIAAWGDAQEVVNSIKNFNLDFDQWKRPAGEFQTLASHEPANVPGTGHVPATPPMVDGAPGPAFTFGAQSVFTVTDSRGNTFVVTFPPGTYTVAQIASALAGGAGPWTTTGSVGAWTATADPSNTFVIVTGTVTGGQSTLTISGGNTNDVFGADPATDTGEDASDPDLESVDHARTTQISFSSLPEDLRDQLRPLYQAWGDWLAIYDKAFTAVGDAASMVLGQLQPPSLVGLIAKDGITIGTNGPIYGAGGGIAFVATGRDDPDPSKSEEDNPTEADRDKFVPIVEKWVNWSVDGDDPAQPWQKGLIPDSDARKGNRGSFRVAAERDIVMTGQRSIIHVSVGEALFMSKRKMTLASNRAVSIRSYSKSVEVLGKEIRIGAFGYLDESKYGGKQKVTSTVNIAARSRIDLRTKDLRAYLADNLIVAGKNDADKGWVDTKGPHLLIDTTEGARRAMIGNWNEGSDFYGVVVAVDDGVTALTGKTKVSVGVPNGAGFELSQSAPQLKVFGNLAVGSALRVTSSGPYTAPGGASGMLSISAISPKEDQASIKTQYATLIAKAGTESGLISTGTGDDAKDADKAKVTPNRILLRADYYAHDKLLDKARTSELTPADLEWKPADEDVFAQRGADNLGPPLPTDDE